MAVLAAPPINWGSSDAPQSITVLIPVTATPVVSPSANTVTAAPEAQDLINPTYGNSI